jgi:hypothetical protein
MAGFTAADLLGVAYASALFSLFAFIPGFTIGWSLDLVGFRGRGLLHQCLLSCTLSIALCPVLTYLCELGAGPGAVWWMYGALWAGFAVILIASRLRQWRLMPAAVVVAAGWAIVVAASTVDLQIGDRLYPPMVSYDYSVRVAMISALSRHFPPLTPFLSDGHQWPLQYHYYWFLLCSLVHQIAHGAVRARQALIAGTIWSGLGLMSVVLLYLRHWMPSPRRRAFVVGISLLAVTGLDIIPCLWLGKARGSLLPTIELWNADQVSAWFTSALWVPHHVAALVACLTGFLVIWVLPGGSWTRRHTVAAVAAGVAFATAAGTSVYVTLGFAVFCAVWLCLTAYKRWWTDAAAMAVAGLVAAVLAVPFLRALGPSLGGGPMLRLGIRRLTPFAPVEHQGWIAALALLPLNYALEFGFFLVAGIGWLRTRRSLSSPTRYELCGMAMAGSSLVLCTFVRSTTISSNDLGWRGMLLAQFVLLVWATEWLMSRRFRGGLGDVLLTLMVVLGLAGTAYEVLMQRAYPVLIDSGRVATLEFLGPDRQVGKRTYAMRQVYERLQSVLPRSAVVQHNPDPDFNDLPSELYSERQVAATNKTCDVPFGGTPGACAKVVDRVSPIFDPRTSREETQGACQALGISVLVFRDTDAAWKMPGHWMRSASALAANDYARAIACGSGSLAASAPATVH